MGEREGGQEFFPQSERRSPRRSKSIQGDRPGGASFIPGEAAGSSGPCARYFSAAGCAG
jgi:hypothetical protein